MMISEEKIEKIMKMSYIKLASKEKVELAEDLKKILNWVDKLQEVDTTGVMPIISMSPHTSQLAPDEPEQGLSVQNSLKNAPEDDGAYFHVPSKKKVKS